MLVAHVTQAAVNFTVSPAGVSNTYNGTITLQITGLTNTESVVIQEYLDLNTNGIIDGGDLMVQQFNLTDGQTGIVIGGVTNFNVPRDVNATAGAITATMDFRNGNFVPTIAGKYLYKLSSPVNHFAPITTNFSVTNLPFAQKFTGNVVSNSTSTTVPDAIVLLFPKNLSQSSPLAGVVANDAGNYSLPAPPGTYSLLVYRSNYVGSFTGAPEVTLAASQTLTTNLTLAPATSSISGKVIDATNSNVGLPGTILFARSLGGLFTLAFSDTNGNFNIPVTADTWQLEVGDTTLIVLGYVGPQSGAYANAGTTGWTFDCHKATALIYGHISDNLGNPLAGLDVYANDNSLYQTDAYTDANGNYVLGVVGLGMSDHWNVQADGNHQFNNYVFTQETINGNINAGQAVLQNFTAVLATNQIAGYVSFNGNAVTNLEIFADAAINGTNYHVDINTDANGNYSFGAANGSWTVGVTVSGGDDSLDNILGSGNFQPPPDQVINISNNNAVANFTVLPPNSGQIFGYVTDTSGNPVAGVNVGVSDGIGDNYTTTTDAGGYYSFIVNNDNWDAVVDCAGLNSRGYQCVSDQMTAVLDNYVELDFSAQFVNLQLPLRVLHSFTDTSTNSFGAYTNGDGAYLYGGLVLSGNTLYGTAVGGGTNGNGTVFAVDTDIAGFTNLYSFKATEGSFSTNSDGANPQASLILLGNALYGTATVGGTNGSGTVFKLGTNGTGFTTLHPFAAADANPDGAVTNKDGANPQCSLIVSGNAVYGTAAAGGTNGNGTVFKINTDGTGFTNLHTFAATSTDSAGLPTNNDGAYPVAGLTLSGDTLYGTAAVGGINGNGTLFAVKTNGTSFSVLHAFTALDPFFGTNSDGANPVGGLILAGNMLYGTASSGGIAFFGTVFAVGTNGSGFTTLHSFADSDGSNPQAGLILSSNTLYGTALNGGSSGFGAVFEIKTNGTGFGDLYGFTGGSDGANPYGGLVLSGNNLYGTASAGGDAGNGTVFSLPLGSVSTNAPQLTISLAGTLVMLTWPTNATGFTLQSTTNLAPPTVWSTNLPAPVVINGKNTVTNPVTGRQTFYRLSH